MACDEPLTCVEIGEEADDGPSSPPEYDIVTSHVDFTLGALCGRMDSRKVVLSDLRRKYAWDVRTASRLVESFIVGLPVPPVYMLEERDDRQLVIDGFRRLCTIRAFFAGRGEQEFRLEVPPREAGSTAGRSWALARPIAWHSRLPCSGLS